MPIQILPPDEAMKKAKERVAEWKRQREIDGAKARAEGKKAEPEPEKGSKQVKKDINSRLIKASAKGDTKEVLRLIGKGADVNARTKQDETALMRAAWYGWTETATTLIANGADVNAKTNDGMTALMIAAFHGYAKTAEMLIATGADVNAKTNDGNNALYFAHNRTEIVELLKKHGATE